MEIRKEHIRINSEMNRLYTALTNHCDIPIHHPEYVSRANRLLLVIRLLLGENYQELNQIQINLFQLGCTKLNNSLTKYSIALKNAMDVILEDKDGRSYLIHLLSQLENVLIKNITKLNATENQELNFASSMK